MIKTVKVGGRGLFAFKKSSVFKRTYLSEAYKCDEAWNRRFESPLLNKITPEAMFIKLKQKLDQVGKIHAVDADIFANTIKAPTDADELLLILQKLRLSSEATNILNSTHYAVVRYLLENNHINTLHTVLHNRLEYGIIPDHVSYNILMDHFINKEDYASAAKVAVLLMLQEDSDHPISNALCTYSCHKYLEKPEDWKLEPEPVKDDPDDEIIKVRVKYIRNPFFDDHFDIKEPKHLVGKTLVFQGKLMKDTLGRSLQLRGLILYNKYAAAIILIKEWLSKDTKELVYEEIFNLIENDNSHISGEQDTDEFKMLKNQLIELKKTNLYKGNLTKDLEDKIKLVVSEFAEKDIAAQYQAFDAWEKKRTICLEEQYRAIEKEERLAKLQEMKQELEEREKILTFFENEEKIELQIEKKLEEERKFDEKVAKKMKKRPELRQTEEYIPPEVGRYHVNQEDEYR
ncbi:uncharacterized protein [Prorops nasuta]|uniref:uncharacterized protein n=1 Tax=Prorops nasuta TaxID=863751 RepID=UPI0034CFEEA3